MSFKLSSRPFTLLSLSLATVLAAGCAATGTPPATSTGGTAVTAPATATDTTGTQRRDTGMGAASGTQGPPSAPAIGAGTGSATGGGGPGASPTTGASPPGSGAAGTGTPGTAGPGTAPSQ
jgi:hypothetical protein